MSLITTFPHPDHRLRTRGMSRHGGGSERRIIGAFNWGASAFAVDRMTKSRPGRGPAARRPRAGRQCAHRMFGVLLALLALSIGACRAAAHDVPTDVRLNLFVKPEGDRLQLIIRAPLQAMQEVDIPTRGPGYLDLARADDALRAATKLWLIDNIAILEGDAALPAPRLVRARVSLPSDKSFAGYDTARAHVLGPGLPESLDLYWNQQFLDVLLEYPIRSDRAPFAIRLKVDRLGLRVGTALRFLPPSSPTRAFEFHGDPGLVRLDPSWHQAAMRFVAAGVVHILEGFDHLLFIVCLVIPFRRLRPMVVIVTSFTVAHSISLVAAALGFVPDALWFPPLVEALIAATIVYMALENIFGSEITRRWVLTFAFGLVHGFGFSFALRETLQFAGDHLVASLLAFNVGVELGQLAVLLVLVPALNLLFARLPGERVAIIVLSALVAHTAWHWMLERGEQLAKFPFPTLDAAFLASAMRGLLAAIVLAGLVALVRTRLARWLEADRWRR
ncbi:MAG: HupE/UreJ family protein [Alphaproteobacteria bacterium]|nr:HupE/UreJ family protein [Alphaproteobacteria bacterium]